MADDEGRFSANPKTLKAFIFPFDDDMKPKRISEMCLDFAKAGLITLYQAGGKLYGAHPNWKEFQHPNRAYPSRIPSPEDGEPVVDIDVVLRSAHAVRTQCVGRAHASLSVTVPVPVAVADPVAVGEPTTDEVKILKTLQEIPQFRRDDAKNLDMIRRLSEAHPAVDLAAVAKSLALKIQTGAKSYKQPVSAYVTWVEIAAREGYNPKAKGPGATRQRCPVHGTELDPCQEGMWCACCNQAYPRGDLFQGGAK